LENEKTSERKKTKEGRNEREIFSRLRRKATQMDRSLMWNGKAVGKDLAIGEGFQRMETLKKFNKRAGKMSGKVGNLVASEHGEKVSKGKSKELESRRNSRLAVVNWDSRHCMGNIPDPSSIINARSEVSDRDRADGNSLSRRHRL